MTNAIRDANRVPTTLGVDSSDSTLTKNIIIDNATGRLLVSAVITSSSGEAATIADGADVAEGATADAAVTAGSTGTVSGKLRTISSDVSASKPVAQGSTTSGQSGVLIQGAVTTVAPSYTTAQTSPLSLTTTGGLRIASASATGSAVPANASYTGILDASGNLTGAKTVTASLNTTAGVMAAGLVALVDDTSPVAVTENQFGPVRMSTDKSLLTTIQNSYAHISTSTTTTVKSGAGTLKAIIVNTLGTVASTTTIYDNTAGSGTVIGVINTLALGGTFTFDVQFTTGLTIVTTGTAAPDLTVSYK